MRFKIVSHTAVIALMAGLLVSKAQAIAITDVNFRIQPGAYENPSQALLGSGNDSVAGVNALFPGDPWTLLDKTDAASSVFNGVTFVLTGGENSTSGSWGLSWSGSGVPLTMDFIFVTKAANNWGAYLFEAVSFTSSPLVADGQFAISWKNRGGQTPGLSHASIYGRLVDQPVPVPQEPITVPLPSSLPLLILGLGLIRLGRARRK